MKNAMANQTSVSVPSATTGMPDHLAQRSLPGAAAANQASIAPPAKPQRLVFELAKLVAHPLQDVYNPPCSHRENAMLDDDLRAGQREPIHVMPPGNHAGLPAYTILDGHRRAESLRRLGKTNATIVIRWDLLETDSSMLEGIFLRFNVNRRQLDPLSVAINIKRQTELGNGGPLNSAQLQALDQTLKGILGGCIRNIQRYLHAADAPLEIQTALRRGDITLTMASRVGGLDPDIQQQIASAIEGITDRSQIRQINCEYIAKYGARSPAPLKGRQTPKAVKLIKELESRLSDLQINRIHGPGLAPHLPALQKIQAGVQKLIAAAKRPSASISELEGKNEEIAGHGVRK
jgi:ParB-like chromosome segregation protein Spo0J